jgi:hypothetical protein
MSEWTITTLRAALVRSRGVFGRPYPAMARAAALEWAERRQREGADLQSIASELGVSPTTLRKWREPQSRPSDAFCSVQLVPAAGSSSPVVVHARSGIRIEGLSLAELAEFVRRLG